MAVAPYEIVKDEMKAKIVKWVLTGTDTEGAPYQSDYPDKSVQMFGTFGGTVTLEASNEPYGKDDDPPTNYAAVADPWGDPIALTAAGMAPVAPSCNVIRPRVSVGAVTSVTVLVYMRG